MALTKELTPGQRVWIEEGPFKGLEAFVTGPTDEKGNITTYPDTDVVRRRKVDITVHDMTNDSDEGPVETTILPRMLHAIDPHARAKVVANREAMDQARALDKAALVTEVAEHGVVEPIMAEPITDPMDPILDRFRPDPEVVNEYVSRRIPGGYIDYEYLLDLRDKRDKNGYSPNVALVGETQSGKTMLVHVLAVLAAERDGMPKPYPVFTLSGSSGVTNYDLYGMTTSVFDAQGREVLVWMEGLVPTAAMAGGILYLDEWNAVSPSQAVALHPLLDFRRSFVNTQKAVPNGHGGFMPEVVKASTNLWVLSTINPGYRGTQLMAEASTNRFQWLEWDYDENTEKALIKSTTIRVFGDHLREARERKSLTVPVGTSALMALNEKCSTFGAENALWSFMGMFPPAERIKVETILDDEGIRPLLLQEYPTPDRGQTEPDTADALAT